MEAAPVAVCTPTLERAIITVAADIRTIKLKSDDRAIADNLI